MNLGAQKICEIPSTKPFKPLMPHDEPEPWKHGHPEFTSILNGSALFTTPRANTQPTVVMDGSHKLPCQHATELMVDKERTHFVTATPHTPSPVLSKQTHDLLRSQCTFCRVKPRCWLSSVAVSCTGAKQGSLAGSHLIYREAS